MPSFTSSAKDLPEAASATIPASVKPRFEYFHLVSVAYVVSWSETVSRTASASGNSNSVQAGWMDSRGRPAVWVSRCRTVTARASGCRFSMSNQGRCSVMGSSRRSVPASRSRSTLIAVKSFEWEAIRKIESSLIGVSGSRDACPYAFRKTTSWSWTIPITSPTPEYSTCARTHSSSMVMPAWTCGSGCSAERAAGVTKRAARTPPAREICRSMVW